MEMTFRWYGSKFDTVTLEQIRQIPGVTGVITTLYDTTPGEVWTREAIHALKEEVEASGLHISGIESVNIHDAIKIGSPDREQYPAWSVFGLPRIIINKENILRMMKMVDDPHNGVTFCSGSYGTNLENDLPDMIRSLKGRIHFAHVRNLKFHSQQDFEEAAHLSSDGSFDMYEIMKALYDIGFDGPIRPDHGRMIWGEKAMPGYGLYDRALGVTYLNGLWEAIDKSHKRGI